MISVIEAQKEGNQEKLQAAWSVAEAARSAAEAARSAVWAAAFEQYADKLLELIAGCN